MHKRKYTKEQLEFYFKRLMDKIKRVPTEEDLAKAAKKDSYPSTSAYADRFGSWSNAVKLFANFDLAKRKCLHCGKILVKKMKTQKFCSDVCAKKHYVKKSSTYTKAIDKKIKEILNDECFVCSFKPLVEIHCLDNKKESPHKILQAFNKRDLHQYVLLCPNHHSMIHLKMAKFFSKKDELVWEE